MIAVLLAIALFLFLLLGAISIFLRAEPAKLAGNLRGLGPALAALVGITLVLAARPVAGGAILLAALAWYVSMRGKHRLKLARGRHSMVRTAALEMELDHDTGGLEGLVLAGRHEGRVLGAMGRADLQQLYRELSGDPESRQLLETYLDGRFPVWRDNAKTNGDEGLGVAPGPGPMTKEEAYKVLGLEAGAAAADVRKAHRRLMQRLHPDVGGTSFLAARINEAKDVLLSDHN
jgi:hypothetical protein